MSKAASPQVIISDKQPMSQLKSSMADTNNLITLPSVNKLMEEPEPSSKASTMKITSTPHQRDVDYVLHFSNKQSKIKTTEKKERRTITDVT